MRNPSLFLFAAILILVVVSCIVILQPFLKDSPISTTPFTSPERDQTGIKNKETIIGIGKTVSIVSVSQQSDDGAIHISGLTTIPGGSPVLYEVWPANVIARKATADEIFGISGKTFAYIENKSTVWSIDLNRSSLPGGNYIIIAWPEESEARYGDRKEFFLPLNETITHGSGRVSVNGVIILAELSPSEASSVPVSMTPRPTP
jgi:hypothetical protein